MADRASVVKISDTNENSGITFSDVKKVAITGYVKALTASADTDNMALTNEKGNEYIRIHIDEKCDEVIKDGDYVTLFGVLTSDGENKTNPHKLIVESVKRPEKVK